MNLFTFNPYCISLIFTTLSCTILAMFIRTRKHTSIAYHLIALLVLVNIWCVSYALELCFISAEHKLIAIMVQYVAIPSIPAVFALFVYRYTHRYTSKIKHKMLLGLFFVIPCIATLLMLTNSWHHLMYTGWTLTGIPGKAYTFLFPDYGIGFIVSAIYSYAIMIFVFVYIFYISVKTTKLFSAQAILLLCCALIPIISNLMYFNKGSSSVNFDITPVAFLLSAGLLTYLVTGTTLLDLQPLARDIIIENASDGMIFLDCHNTVLDLNPMAETIFSVKKNNVLGVKSHTFLSALPQLDIKPDQSSTTELHLNDRIYTIIRLPIHNTAGKYVGQTLSVRDITLRKVAESRIKQLAYQDLLTGLPNHTHMLQKLDSLITRSKRQGSQIIILHVHITNVNYINSSYGHDMGDALIKEVTELLRPMILNTYIFARTNGAGFIIAVPEYEAAFVSAKLLSDRIMHLFTHPINVRDKSIFASIGIGICISPDDGDAVETLVQRAGLALELAKTSRTHYAFYFAENELEITERNALVGALGTAVADDQFSLAYQPQYNSESKSLCGVEALLRWTHPKLGNIPPDRFIYLLEDSGLIIPVGNWVITEATRQYKKWLDLGLDIPKYSINLSVKQFYSDDLIPHILDTLASNGIARHCLELEITETLAAVADKRVVSQICALTDAGIRIAIDDFGAGFSSLTYFKYLNINTLKIDKEISADIHYNKFSCAIFESLKLMCDTLGVDMITEHVETDDQLKKLLHLGCKHFQGYYYSKPLTPNAFEEFTKLLSVDNIAID